MRLKGINIVFDNNTQTNLFNTSINIPPVWPKYHPIYLTQQAKNNNTNAMIQLGNYTYRDADYDKAKYWFEKALEAGDDNAKKRLQALEQSIALSQ